MKHFERALACAGAAALLLAGCDSSGDGSGTSGAGTNPGNTRQASGPLTEIDGQVPPAVRPPLGGPIPGLTQAELDAFDRGKLVFEKRFKPSEGMGPMYNATSCASCHSTPTIGGSSQLYRNFYVAVYDVFGAQQFTLPDLPSIVVPAYGRDPSFSLEAGRIVIPDMVGSFPTISAQRNAIPIFGTGLFEFVSNATIFSLADPNDMDSDGISGRFNTDSVGVGRFGTKLQANNVELFTRPPLFNQMGITSDPFLGAGGAVSLAFTPQGTGDPNDPTTDNDGVPDPELSTADLGDLIAFTRFLAPPGKKLPFSNAAERGEDRFDQLGCVKCHVPSLPSSRGPVEAYTDLLLHDMGPDLADGLFLGVPQTSSIDPATTGDEFRTQPLWGVSLHAPFLHDGRAETLHDAIEMHAGEAQAIRDAYMALSPSERADVIEFLEHL